MAAGSSNSSRSRSHRGIGEHDEHLVATMPAGDERVEQLEPVRLSLGDETVQRER